MKFNLKRTDTNSKARTGIIETDHGSIETPVFMPVGTGATVKAVHQRELKEDIEANIILGNTYHLYLRPGLEVIKHAGGLHRFMGWDMPILTDSGGYQVYSLAGKRKISKQGVMFSSHIDGSLHEFTPEKVIDIQHDIGADIIMAFDECTPFPCSRKYATESMELTHQWLKRCVVRMDEKANSYGHDQALFPIVQGSTLEDLRRESAEVITSFECDGNAIGGLSVGESMDEMYAMTELVCDILPINKPRYLMGVGTPVNILECIAVGVDMFDCVMPTRNGRNGMLFTSNGILNIRNEKWKNDLNPIDELIGGYSSTFYSRSYLRHLILSKEILGAQIASIHNLTFYLWLAKQAREKIEDGTFSIWKKEMVEILNRKL